MSVKMWVGTEESYAEYVAAIPLAKAREDQYRAANGDKAEPEFPPLYELQGDVGVISINGSLIQGEAGFFRYYGMVGYEDIKAATLEGIKDKKAKTLMLSINSPGGSVAGLSSAAEFLTAAAEVKPMSAHAELMASGGYWLGSVASHITLGDTAVAGSIGVLRIMAEHSKQLEKDGVTVTVMRAGKYKALGNGYEPLTEEAKAEVQSKLDDIYASFVSSVATNRGTSYAVADQVMGQGREFLGVRALEAGLVDAIGSYSDAMAFAKKNKDVRPKTSAKVTASVAGGVASASLVNDNSAISHKSGPEMKQNLNLNAEQLAAIAAGGSVEAVTGSPAPVVETPDTPEGEPATESVNPEVEALQAELATAQASLVEANDKLTAAASQVSDLTAVEASLKTIVTGVVSNMRIAIGQRASSAELSSADLVAEHASVSALFKEKYKVGGVAASTSSTEVKAPVPSASLLRELAAAKSIPVPKRK